MKRYLIPVLLLLIAVALLFVKSDRLVLQLIPTPGMANAITMNSSHTYEQDIIMHSATIARAGFYLAPAVASLPSEPLTLTLSRNGQVVASTTTSSVFIDADGSTLWQFDKPPRVTPGETIKFAITIPESLSDKVRIKLRQPDDSFNSDSARFFQDGKRQTTPLAYELYSYYKPPLSLQIAGLLALAAIILALRPRHTHLIVTIEALSALWFAFLYLTPFMSKASFPWFLLIIQAAAFYGMFCYLRSKQLHIVTAVAGAALFAFTSWWPLQYSAHRFVFGMVALLPTIAAFASKSVSKTQKIVLVVFAIVSLGAILMSGVSLSHSHVPVAAHVRDVFLDPYQAPVAQKVFLPSGQNIPWDNFGSYIGVLGIVLAVIGLAATAKKHWLSAILLLLFLILQSTTALASMTAQWSFPIALSHLSILSTFLIAFFAAQGIEWLYKFFGYHHRLSAILINTVVIIVLVDMWHIAADLLESLP